MTLIVITKTSQGYSASVQNTVALANKEEQKPVNSKVIEKYLGRLLERKEQIV